MMRSLICLWSLRNCWTELGGCLTSIMPRLRQIQSLTKRHSPGLMKILSDFSRKLEMRLRIHDCTCSAEQDIMPSARNGMRRMNLPRQKAKAENGPVFEDATLLEIIIVLHPAATYFVRIHQRWTLLSLLLRKDRPKVA
jgi:hypothetical protein